MSGYHLATTLSLRVGSRRKREYLRRVIGVGEIPTKTPVCASVLSGPGLRNV